MSTVTDFEAYLSAMAKASYQQPHTTVANAGLPFVTISRQAGAGGKTLAQALLQAMATEQDSDLFQGWQIFDRQLCEELFKRKHLQDSLQSLLGEQYHTKVSEFVLGLLGQHTPQDTVIMRQSEIIRSLATVGKVIIVGRAASQATKGLTEGINMRLVAPDSNRIKRIMAMYDKNEKDAQKIIQEQDEARARLLKDHYQVAIDDPLLYDVTWNTGAVSVEAIAMATIAAIKQQRKALVL